MANPFQEPQTWRWIPAGESFVVGDLEITGGMVYVGRAMRALNGYAVEPSLVNPALRTARVTPRGPLFDFWPSYSAATPVGRRIYLEWLAGGRRGILHDERCLMLFFYGLERRLLEHNGTDLLEGEEAQIRAEIQSLIETYPAIGYFVNYANVLLNFLALCDWLKSDAIPSPEPFLQPPHRRNEIPPQFELALSRMCQKKLPLTAEYALAWYLLDPEVSPRVAVTRCPGEMRELFTLRFDAKHPKGMKLNSIRARLNLTYFPASRGFGTVVYAPTAEADLNRVSHTPLRAIRDLGYACADELAPYARRIAKDTEVGIRLTTVAALPTPLFLQSDIATGIRAALQQQAAKGAQMEGELFLTLVQNSTVTPGKAENIALLTALETLGFAVEPDARLGAPSFLSVAQPVYMKSSEPLTEADRTAMLFLAPLLSVIATLARPETGTLVEEEIRALEGIALRLPHTASDAVRARIPMRLRYLLAATDTPKTPRKLAPDMIARERKTIANAFAQAATLRPVGVSVAKTKELARLYRLLEQDETALYSRLHAAQTDAAELPTVRGANTDPTYAIPADGTPKRTKRIVRTLDMEAIARKQVETAQVSALLTDIFTDDVPVAPANAAVVKADTPAPIGDTALVSLLDRLIGRESIAFADFASFCSTLGLLANGAYEAINELAFDQFDEPALEGDDPIFVNADIAAQLRPILT